MLTDIQRALISHVETMTISGGYNSDYSSTQQDDFNKVTSWPLVNVFLLPVESVFNQIDFPDMNSYRNIAQFEFHCFNKMAEEEDNSDFEIDYVLNDMLHDVKKLLGINPTLGDVVEFAEYKGSRRERSGAGDDIFIPKKLIVKIDIAYSQSRTDPTQLACV